MFASCAALLLSLILAFFPGHPSLATTIQEKYLNFVFLHGMGATSASTQSLADAVEAQAQGYISTYEQANPGLLVKVNTLQRSYPATVDVETWANNIAEAVQQHFSGKKNLILIGHSMGGKAAL